MRTSHDAPLARRQGVFRSTVVFAVALCALAAAPAHASNVAVTFGVSAVTYADTADLCELSVPADSNGIVVLDAAKAAGCITSYSVKHYSFGDFVDCIDEVCGAPQEALGITYWAYYENGGYADHGVDGYSAAAGDEVTYAYTTWAPCLLPTGCLP